MPEGPSVSSFTTGNTAKAKASSFKNPNQNLQTLSDISSSPRNTDSPRVNFQSKTKPFSLGKDSTENVEPQNTESGPQNVFHNKSLKQYKSIKDENKKPTYNRRPSTLISPTKKKVFSTASNNDTFLHMFKVPPDRMINQNETDDIFEINIRPFNSKFIRELNFKQNQRFRKNRKKVQINLEKENLENIEQKNKRSMKPYNRKQMQEMWYNGIRIISEFKNDIIHGQTEIYYPNGAKFIGKYELGVRIFGSFDFNNGYVYWGGFLGDKFQGEGHITLPNKKVYSGEWSGNQLVGKVQIKYPSGDVYYGEVKDFKKHGKGYLFFKSGQKFIGEFEDGNITGKGEYFINEECVGRGIWKDGELITPIAEDTDFQFFGDTKSYMSSKRLLTSASNKQLGNVPQEDEEDEDEDQELEMEGVDDEPININMKNTYNTMSIQDIETKQENMSMNNLQEKKILDEQKKSSRHRRDSSEAHLMAIQQKAASRNNFEENTNNTKNKIAKQTTLSFCDVNTRNDNSSRNSARISSEFEYTTSKNMLPTTQKILDDRKDFVIPNNQKVDGQDNGLLNSGSTQFSNSSLIKKTARFKSIGTLAKSKNGTVEQSTDSNP